MQKKHYINKEETYNNSIYSNNKQGQVMIKKGANIIINTNKKEHK